MGFYLVSYNLLFTLHYTRLGNTNRNQKKIAGTLSKNIELK